MTRTHSTQYLKLKQLLANTIVDDILMVVLALFSVALLIVETNTPLTGKQSNTIVVTDLVIAGIFLVEWIIRFIDADDRKLFVKKYWWELLASIPIPSNFAQALRALRVLRVLRIIRLAVRLKQVSDFSKTLSKHSYVIQILIVFLSVTFIASVVFDTFERGLNTHVHNSWDSFWWATATATTIGYGDIYPVTTAGRIDALFLAFFGIGVLGLLTAKIATTLIKENNG
jgi:voltage-gated potassium channel